MTDAWLLAGAETDAETLWALLDWCVEHGADEFTLEVMAIAGTPAAEADAFEDELEDVELAAAVRPVLDTSTGPEFPGRVRLWPLDRGTLRLLRRFHPLGPLAYGAQGPGEAGWFENLTIYRRGRLLFAALTHERQGVLRVTRREHDELAPLGLPLRALRRPD